MERRFSHGLTSAPRTLFALDRRRGRRLRFGHPDRSGCGIPGCRQLQPHGSKDVSTGNIPHALRLRSSGNSLVAGNWRDERVQSGSPVAVTRSQIRTPSPDLASSGRTCCATRRSLPMLAQQAAGSTRRRLPPRRSSRLGTPRETGCRPRVSDRRPDDWKDLSITERVRLELRAEAFNSLNTPPLGNPNGAFGTSAFGTITSALDPRVFEVVGKIRF